VFIKEAGFLVIVSSRFSLCHGFVHVSRAIAVAGKAILCWF
jgi:hypothetical protein